jgi:hypothetical protein
VVRAGRFHPVCFEVCFRRLMCQLAELGAGQVSRLRVGMCWPNMKIFAEEVVRGGPAFAISLVLSAIEPTLRQLAELGAWQVGAAGLVSWLLGAC